MRLLAPNGALGLPYGRSFLASFSDVVVLTVMLRLVGGIRLARITDVVGLRRPAARSIVSLATILSVATIVCALTAPQSASLRFADLAWLGIGGPVFEEITYRGLAIGGLMVFSGWRFFPAALIPSVVFGVAHASQGQSLLEAAGVVAITALGSLLFGWLYVRWRKNLWPAIVAHCGTNMLWEVFAMGDSAIGGWYGNAVRLALIIAIVGSTWWLTRDDESSKATLARG